MYHPDLPRHGRVTGRKAAIAGRWSMRIIILAGILPCVPLFAHPQVELESRHHVIDGIYESVYSVRTGSGEFDRIRIHRVVKEERGEPIETNKAVMLVHGDVWGFNPAFMPAESPGHSLPAYLAAQGADVWGVDLAWTLVPRSTTNFEFMRNWGLQHDIDDVNTAMDAASKIRKIRKNRSLFTLLGWSRGAWIIYGLLNQESQRPAARQRVKGAIPFDGAMKYTDGAIVAYACRQAAAHDTSLQRGEFRSDNTVLPLLAGLAEDDPNSPSSVLGPLFTNRQALLQIGAAAFALFGPSFAPQYHFVAGEFPNSDLTQKPTGLQYTDLTRFTKFMRAASPYMPIPLLRDTFQVSCKAGSSGRFDDHLSDIRIPILYVGARGGFGTSGLGMLSMLGSTQIETLYVALQPQNEAGLDFAHVDLLNARNAQSLVWSGIDQWLTVHANDSIRENR